MTDEVTSTLVQSGSRTYVASTASGLDTSALVDIAYEQAAAPAVRIDAQVSENAAEISAYEQMLTLTSDLQAAVAQLARSQGGTDADGNVFADKAAYYSATGGADAAQLIGVSVDQDAQLGSYEIEVVQTAQAMKVMGAATADPDAGLGLAGSFEIGIVGETSVALDVTAEMSLRDLAAALDDVDAGVTATLVQVATDDYRLLLSSAETAQEISITPTAGDDVFAATGVTDGAGSFLNVTSQPQDAVINIDGVEARRPTNDFDDLIDGVDLSLLSEAPGTVVTVEIAQDYGAVKDAVTGFVDAYNAYRAFAQTQQSVDESGVASEDAVLFADPLLRTLNDQLYDDLNDSYGDGSGLSGLTAIGLAFDAGNSLVIDDEAALDDAIVDDFASVRALFKTSMSTSDDRLVLHENTSAQDLSFALELQILADGTITGATADGDANAFEISGSTLTGKAGTAYEGLTFFMVGDADVTIDVSITQGLADRLRNTTEHFAASDGVIQSQVNSMLDVNADLEQEAQQIRERAERVREREIDRYAKMEAQVEAAQLLRDQIAAILGGEG